MIFRSQNFNVGITELSKMIPRLAKTSGLLFSRITLVLFSVSSSEFCNTNLNIKTETCSKWDHFLFCSTLK